MSAFSSLLARRRWYTKISPLLSTDFGSNWVGASRTLVSTWFTTFTLTHFFSEKKLKLEKWDEGYFIFWEVFSEKKLKLKKTWNARDFIFWEESESRIFLTLSLPRSIKFKFTLQSHQKYYITEDEELSFSQLTQMKDDKIPILTTLLIHFSLNGWENVLGS